MTVEARHVSGLPAETEPEIDPALLDWMRRETEMVLSDKHPAAAANEKVLELSGRARRSGAMVDRLKAWLVCKALTEHADALGGREVMGQQQILAGFAYMHPTIDDGYYKAWIKTHPGPAEAPRATEDLAIYKDIFSPDEQR